MTVSGPPRASAATTAPKIGMKRATVDGPKTFPTSVAAAIAITRSSDAAQPRSWNTFSAVGMYDPRRPRIGRRLTIVGTPARLPWWAAAASITLPSTEPTNATTADSASVRPNPKPPTPIRSVPAARTSSPAPRLDHSTNKSKVRRTRNAIGTASTPHSGGLRRRTIGRPKPPRIYRVREPAATDLFLGLRELLVRMLERGDEREFSPREEIDEGSASRAHVIDPVRQAELFDCGDGVPAPDDREAVCLGDGREDAVHEVLLEHVPRDRDGVVCFHASEEGDLRTLGLLDRVAQHGQFALHHATREGGQHLAEPDEARLRPVGRGERIEDKEVRVGREPAHDVGLRHLLKLRVRERFFLRIEAGVLEHDDVPDLHRSDRLDRGPTE